MKKIILFALILFSFTAKSQTDSLIWYKDTVIQWKIDTAATWGDDSISQPPNYLRLWYSYIDVDSIIQFQFIFTDSLGNWKLPIWDLINNGWRSNGTVLRIKGTSEQINWTPIQIKDSLYLPSVINTFGENNVN